MNTKYTIKNFRVFDEDGAAVNLKPITILTGCNSSGKSSVVKSLMLLSDYLHSFKEDADNGKRINLTEHYLDFSRKPNSLLGKFGNVVNRDSQNDTITLSLQVHSYMLCQDVLVELSFYGDERDNLTNGYVKSISIQKLDGTVVYASDKENGSTGNLYCVFNDFLKFVYTQHFISCYQSMVTNKYIREVEFETDSEYKEFVDSLNSYIADFKQAYGKKALFDINRWHQRYKESGHHSFLEDNTHSSPDMIEKIKESGILYYLPLFDEILCGDKESALDFLTRCMDDNTFDAATVSVIKRIVDDFSRNNYSDFLSYYKEKEKEHLSQFNCSPRFLSGAKKSLPMFFSAQNQGRIDGTSILTAPHNTSDIEINLGVETEIPTRKVKAQEIAEWEAQPLTFGLIYEALVIISEKTVPQNNLYYSSPDYYTDFAYVCLTEKLFMKFVEKAIEEIVVDSMPEKLSYVSSSIINVKRLYPLEANDEFTELLKRYFRAKRIIGKECNYTENTFLNRWVKAFGIGHKVTIDVDSEGLGATLRLHRNDNDEHGTLLADTGYGITQLFAILLNIEVAIMERHAVVRQKSNNISPFLGEDNSETVVSTPSIAIEEPEIHLHPRFQSLLADMFLDANKNYGVEFIIETHSEYLVRKLQTLVASGSIKNNEIAIVYVYDNDPAYRPSGMPHVKEIAINPDGRLDDCFGTGFFDEADNLSMDLFNIKIKNNG